MLVLLMLFNAFLSLWNGKMTEMKKLKEGDEEEESKEQDEEETRVEEEDQCILS